MMLAGISIHESVDLAIVDDPTPPDSDETAFIRWLHEAGMNERTTVFYGSLPLAGENRTTQVRDALNALLAQASAELSGVKAIGGSTVGVVRDNHILVNQPRRDWSDFSPVNLRSIVRPFLSKSDAQRKVVDEFITLNDASATAVAVSAIESLDENFVFVETHDGFNIGHVNFGALMTSRSHPEFGHMYPNLHRFDADHGIEGACVYHRNCLEGLLWPETTAKRRHILEVHPESRDRLGSILSFYLAQALYTLVLVYAPEHIVVGGPLSDPEILDEARARLLGMGKGYWNSDRVTAPDFIRSTPVSKRASGMIGALATARASLPNSSVSRIVGSRRGKSRPLFLGSGPNK